MQQRIEDKFTQAHSAREEHSAGEFIRIRRGEFLINRDLGIEEEQGFRQLFGNSIYGWLQEYLLRNSFSTASKRVLT